jgi:hypothetical protein
MGLDERKRERRGFKCAPCSWVKLRSGAQKRRFVEQFYELAPSNRNKTN